MVLLLRHSYGPRVWALPGGGVKAGEDPGFAAMRELEEELGYRGVKLHEIGVLQDRISGSPHSAHIYHCKTDERAQPDQREVLEARFFPAHSLPHPISPRASEALDIWRKSREPDAIAAKRRRRLRR